MTDIKQAIELLERMTTEPAPGEDARLDADELDAVLLAIRALKAPPIKPKKMTIDKDSVVFEYIPRGEWIFEKANNERTDGYICSICGRAYHTKVPYFSEYKYCPNCGALMTSEVTT